LARQTFTPEPASSREALTLEHVDLADRIASSCRRYLPPWIDRDEARAVARLALCEAARSYDPDRHGGTPFSAYARLRIRGAVLDLHRRKNYRYAHAEELPEQMDCRFAEGVIREHERARVRALIEELEPRLQMIVKSHAVGLTFREIGEALPRPVNESRACALFHEAVRELRAKFGLLPDVSV
jgi:RNA polymerase sigma factor (sigma-70 family)